MYVIPIFHRTVNSFDETLIQQVWMLLERNGTFCTSIETIEDAQAYATENDIPLSAPPVAVNGFVFLLVKQSSPLLDQFYTWNETPPDEQPMRAVWRPFLWVINSNSGDDIWGTNTILKDIFLGNSLSAFNIIHEYIRLTA
jgi:hypothetical protein